MPRSALVMIARDEAHCIGRCLASVRPYVDQMIVVDTGSQDDTASIAQRCGAQVHHFAWCDDFAAARNAALAHSSADWNLILDADEWLLGGTEALVRALRAPNGFVGLLPIHSDFDLQGRCEAAVSWIPRLLPAGVLYAGRIHEQPVSDHPRERVAVQVGHDGYRTETLRKKKGRNRSLLLRVLEAEPSDAYSHYQLGRDYEVYEEFEQALPAYAEAPSRSSQTDRFRHDLVVRTLYSLKKLKRFDEALQFAEQEMPHWPESPDFYFALGDLLLDYASANPHQAISDVLPMIEASWLRCLEIGDKPLLEGSVRGRGSYLAAHNLAVLYQEIGDKRKAAQHRKMAKRLRAASEQSPI